EYVIRLGERGMQTKILMCDQGRQNGGTNLGAKFGFQFIHGNHYNFLKGWSNNLYADGHAESRKANSLSYSADKTQFVNPTPSPEELQPRWGRADMYEMY